MVVAWLFFLLGSVGGRAGGRVRAPPGRARCVLWLCLVVAVCGGGRAVVRVRRGVSAGGYCLAA